MQRVPFWKIVIIVGTLLISLWYLTPTIHFYSYDAYVRNKNETSEMTQLDEQIRQNPSNVVDLQNQMKDAKQKFRKLRNNSIRLGLDLQGGVRLVLEVDRKKVEETLRNDKTKTEAEIKSFLDTLLDSAAAVIENRVDQFGVSEVTIVKQGQDRIVLEMPGSSDPEEVRKLVQAEAQLSFHLLPAKSELLRLVSDINAISTDFDKLLRPFDPGSKMAAVAVEFPDNCGLVEKVLARDQVQSIVPREYEFKWSGEEPPSRGFNFTHKLLYLIRKKADLTGASLKTAGMYLNPQNNKPEVALSFDRPGARIFRRVTGDHLHENLAIVLNDRVYSAPELITEIRDGNAVITGINDLNEARQIAVVLRAGALPAPLKVAESRVVGPSLGQDSIHKGIIAGGAGALIVVVFMLVYYTVAGTVADLAVILNIFMLMAGMALFKATLTVPGIAGIFLTIGMAVDANVLIYERMREELEGKRAKTLSLLLEKSYNRAFSAIFDSNITTLITSLVLFQFGTGPIKGFAVTLSLGLIISMYTAIFVTRVVFDMAAARGVKEIPVGKIRIFHHTNYNFFKYPWIFLGASTALGLLGTLYFCLNFNNIKGIDFAGGSELTIQFQNPIAVQDVRNALSSQGISDAVIQQILGGSSEQNQMFIRVREGKIAGTDALELLLHKSLPNNPFSVLSSNMVGAKVGGELLVKGLNCIFFSCIGILLYLTIRFEFKFALGAVLATIHDLCFTLGIIAIFGIEFDLTIIAAVMTVLGYSVNDTIVVFDRIRENYKSAAMNLREVVNHSINETLSRTIITVSTVLFVTLCQYLWGGPVIHGFAFTLLIGVVCGTYSSIFVASQVVLMMGEKGSKVVEVKEKRARERMVTAESGS